ncbi:MAG: hypothetical protein LBL37_09150 [Gracilibacteraceae bacterium]|jgi:hypothetical protein|nr:hypothetical protein [Gracilibacteraceae bacterium]
MARNLTFSVAGREYEVEPVKIERKKLYGWTETVALDDEGNECRVASIDESGTVVIPKGGTGLGILAPDGSWVERGELKAVTLAGEDAALKPSSYAAPIELTRTVSAEDFLTHNITAFYQITHPAPELLAAAEGKIFTFEYLYRDGYEGSAAFLLESEGHLFMLIGYAAQWEMLSLRETAALEDEPEEEIGEEDSDIDFSMF